MKILRSFPLLVACAVHPHNLYYHVVDLKGEGPVPRTYLLRLAPQSGAYRIHFTQVDDPLWTTNCKWDTDFDVAVTFTPSKRTRGGPRWVSTVRVTRVGGKYTDFVVKDMAPRIKLLRMNRKFDASGGNGQWQIGGPGNSAGYSGFEAARAIGIFHVGFLELHYTTHPVALGDSWTQLVRLADESFDGQGVRDTKGLNASCVYRLVSVDPKKQTAQLSFAASTVASATAQRPGFRPSRFTEGYATSGTWTINMRTGMPTAYTANYDQLDKTPGRKQSEHVAIDVRPLS